ncbi:MAG: DNA repair protein RecN [Bacteroidales bacterium]|nr:DNA repair protein RecN [Bacteroidales bacterium]
MLVQLAITNFVLIEKLQIDFSSGFSVITGETGAGKSIMLGALGLILGNRADKEVVMEQEKKCIIEGHFDIEKLQLEAFFEMHDLDYEPICILRREITSAGKSRAFVNDTPINLPLMKELGLSLMDVHSQNQNHQLNNASFRLQIIDAYSSHSDILHTYRELYKIYQLELKRLEQLKNEHLLQANEQEYHQFLFDEIEKAQIRLGEQKEIEEELQILNHAEEIKSTLFLASQELINADENIVRKIEIILDKLNKVSSYQSDIGEIEKRLQSVYIELKDIGEDISALEDQLQFDPSQLEFLNARLDELFSLTRKHRLGNADELLDYQNSLSQKLHSVIHLDEDIVKTEKLLDDQRKSLEEQALKIRKNRQKAAAKIESLLLVHLNDLGMPKAEFKVDFMELNELGPYGKDQINFLFKANYGSKLAEINKVASGGELSRIMLSFKYILALKKALPAIIFDEIDSGVSGEIADKLAVLMKSLGKSMQVISISHLPQIASKADHHYLVYKENESTFTRSIIKKLDKQERLNEIAAMLSGSNIVDSAIEHAKELLGS